MMHNVPLYFKLGERKGYRIDDRSTLCDPSTPHYFSRHDNALRLPGGLDFVMAVRIWITSSPSSFDEPKDMKSKVKLTQRYTFRKLGERGTCTSPSEILSGSIRTTYLSILLERRRLISWLESGFEKPIYKIFSLLLRWGSARFSSRIAPFQRSMDFVIYFKEGWCLQTPIIHNPNRETVSSTYLSTTLPKYFSELNKVRTGASMDFLVGVRLWQRKWFSI